MANIGDNDDDRETLHFNWLTANRVKQKKNYHTHTHTHTNDWIIRNVNEKEKNKQNQAIKREFSTTEKE